MCSYAYICYCALSTQLNSANNLSLLCIRLATPLECLNHVLNSPQLGADPFEINKSGQNALSESYKEGHLHVTYFLKEIARRLKAYFAAYRLSGQLNVNCCDHCLNKNACQECKGASSSSSSSSSETESSSDDDNEDNESVSNGSVVTEHLGGGIRSSLAGPYNANDSVPNALDKLTKVRSDRFSVPRPQNSQRTNSLNK